VQNSEGRSDFQCLEARFGFGMGTSHSSFRPSDLTFSSECTSQSPRAQDVWAVSLASNGDRKSFVTTMKLNRLITIQQLLIASCTSVAKRTARSLSACAERTTGILP
jgi:hypothetical protein